MNEMKKRTIVETSVRVVRNNLRRWYDHASPSQAALARLWYPSAQNWCAGVSQALALEPYAVAAVLSALSPNNKWERNKMDAARLCATYAKGGSPGTIRVCTYNANKARAWSILGKFQGIPGEIEARESYAEMFPASALKTHAFAMNIGLACEEHVTVDRWHVRAALVKPREGFKACVETVTPYQYKRLQEITLQEAARVGEIGYNYQAIIWAAIRDNFNGRFSK